MSDAETKPDPADAEPQDAVQLLRGQGRSPELAAALSWLIPGVGHLYARHFVKGGLSLILVLGLYTWGLLLSRGDAVSLDSQRGHPYAFVAQIGVGGPTLLALAHSKNKLPGFENPPRSDADYREPEYVSRLPDIDTGLLFTMVAGLLNVLLVYDAMRGIPGAIIRRTEDRRLQARLRDLRDELEREAAGEGEPVAAAESTEPEDGADEASSGA
jgi:hypothetical protein